MMSANYLKLIWNIWKSGVAASQAFATEQLRKLWGH